MRVITGDMKVFLSQWADPEQLKESDEKALRQVSLTHCDLGGGYTFIGTAKVVIEIVDENTIILNKVDSLKRELQTVRAKAQKEVNDLEDKIQQLLAITCNTVEVEAA